MPGRRALRLWFHVLRRGARNLLSRAFQAFQAFQGRRPQAIAALIPAYSPILSAVATIEPSLGESRLAATPPGAGGGKIPGAAAQGAQRTPERAIGQVDCLTSRTTYPVALPEEMDSTFRRPPRGCEWCSRSRCSRRVGTTEMRDSPLEGASPAATGREIPYETGLIVRAYH
jgi:hypothetical protein